ncbi:MULTISPECIES: FMN-binding negative transcriptional regulator [unclassified Variovorax]|jgi:transcriptional regulator|uniref:FMN-binding negative transcriptional regulator n=1 Tax=unclassified Variovorax TaxID=663243 RepID=UPI000869E960|nr:MULTISPECIES: FMN-binding negative transcriptional regulator [unclassified Variovorax]MBN8755652.1 FMN-binding negative transcriptional regulator [Variovorax sp.]ODU19205.1 MAG: transcriptional regulator [Variovorax sp. SCN 67-85]ODV23362.1 MAG: transcriptional regulator [Variovorax sp. SCN 67-20]OJZ15994.1 MAG: transcriptional regulator [Variovorax sp. 67-131]
MYIPRQFEEKRPEEIRRIIAEHSLGALIVHGPGGLDATHIPFDFDPQGGAHGVLQAHVARANPVWTENKDGDDVLVIFKGADAYVSPNWYPSKHEFHRQVPTWNYQVVHVRGKLRIRDDERYVRGVVAKLTRVHEGRADVEKPWKMGDSERDYIDRLVAAIVGIEIEVQSIVAVSKLSQNKEERDRLGVVAALKERTGAQTSKAMLEAVLPER